MGLVGSSPALYIGEIEQIQMPCRFEGLPVDSALFGMEI